MLSKASLESKIKATYLVKWQASFLLVLPWNNEVMNPPDGTGHGEENTDVEDRERGNPEDEPKAIAEHYLVVAVLLCDRCSRAEVVVSAESRLLKGRPNAGPLCRSDDEKRQAERQAFDVGVSVAICSILPKEIQDGSGRKRKNRESQPFAAQQLRGKVDIGR
jgi:hypothetical protein